MKTVIRREGGVKVARNNLEDEMFSDFDYMYRHRKKTEAPPAPEQTPPEIAAPAAEPVKQTAPERPVKKLKTAPNLAEKKVEKRKKKRVLTQKEAKKRKNTRISAQKTTVKPKKNTVKPENSAPPIHPAYGKPYKKDTEKDRRRPFGEGGKSVKKTDVRPKKKEKPETKYEKEKSVAENLRLQQKQNELRNRVLIAMLRALRNVSWGLLVGALLFGIVAAAAFVSAAYHTDEEHYKVIYQVGEGESGDKLAYGALFRDGFWYVRGGDIVRLCGFTVTGSASEVKYISPDAGNEAVVFTVGTRRAKVNKNNVDIAAPTVYESGELYIPVVFFTDYCSGLIITVKEETEDTNARITVLRRITNETEYKTQGAAPIYENITFSVKEVTTLSRIDEASISDNIKEENYTIDITDYYDYINPNNIFEYIQIVNKDYPASGNYTYDDLRDIVAQSVTVKDKTLQLRLYAAKALEAMIAEAKAQGVTRYAVFKAYATLEDSNLSDPYTDEHLLGLSVDLYFGSKDVSYGDSAVFAWFAENAHRFGFIVRYPKDKTEQTGVEFRPWTLRYVGRYNATKMYEQKLCLEEYIVKYRLESFINNENE